ncbi:MAG: hypothetical protein Q4A60_06700 [Pasteurellaceae bacterium]|nr:hypothetical protein [Pasteurellaceae bacterium]
MQFRTDWQKVRRHLFYWYKQQVDIAITKKNRPQAEFYHRMMKINLALDRIEFQPLPQQKPFGISEKMDAIIYSVFVWALLIYLMISIFS